MFLLDISTIRCLVNGIHNRRHNYNFQSRIPGEIFFMHAMKTPLTTLQLSLENLEEFAQISGNASLRGACKGALTASKQINNLVNNIPHRGNNDLNSKIDVEDTLKILQQLYSNRDNTLQLIFNVRLVSSQTVLKIDRLYFIELITCLIGNAFESYCVDDRNKVVVVSVVEQKNHLRIQVQDFGQGLSLLLKKMMTLPGFSTKKNGHGFGMWFVKNMVEHHFHSKLKVVSEKNNGTTISFCLPLD